MDPSAFPVDPEADRSAGPEDSQAAGWVGAAAEESLAPWEVVWAASVGTYVCFPTSK